MQECKGGGYLCLVATEAVGIGESPTERAGRQAERGGLWQEVSAGVLQFPSSMPPLLP